MAAEVISQTNGYSAHNGSSEASNQATNTNGNGNGTAEAASPSKDEIGWYFVEQYYTTLSKNPERLHLFYAKRSQFVSGLEAEKAPVCVGQRAISDRIKELDIADAKVRVTNVDAQESGRDIVAQVIGEMSNKGNPHRKFVQTFILAEQPNGYYVLNDIFRYIAEDEEEETEEQATEETAPAQPETAEKNATEEEKTVEILDQKLAETAAEPEIEPAAIAAVGNENPAEVQEPVEAEKDVEQDKPVTPETAAEAVEKEEPVAEEKPKDPEPSPVPAPASPVKPTAAPVSTPAAETSAPQKPAAPKTWASMLAGNKPAIAVPQVPTQAPTQPKTAPKAAQAPAAEAISAPNAVATVAGLTDDSQAPPSPGGWQTAGQEHKSKQHKQQPSSLGGQSDGAAAYIKNVTDKVDASLLKQKLSQYGKMPYFDVSRQKNCAFVEFDSPAAFKAALAANPHNINGVEVIVAPRHRAGGNGFPRGGAAGGVRGGRGGLENRTNSQGGRGGFNKDNGRGDFANRGARGGAAQRGRGGAAQAA